MKQLIITFFLMSGICYGQETKSALIFRNNTSQNNSYVDFKGDPCCPFKISDKKQNVKIQGDTILLMIDMAKHIEQLTNELKIIKELRDPKENYKGFKKD